MKERNIQEMQSKLEHLTQKCHKMKFTETQMRFLEVTMAYVHNVYNVELEDAYDDGYSKGFQRATEVGKEWDNCMRDYNLKR